MRLITGWSCSKGKRTVCSCLLEWWLWKNWSVTVRLHQIHQTSCKMHDGPGLVHWTSSSSSLVRSSKTTCSRRPQSQCMSWIKRSVRCFLNNLNLISLWREWLAVCAWLLKTPPSPVPSTPQRREEWATPTENSSRPERLNQSCTLCLIKD